MKSDDHSQGAGLDSSAAPQPPEGSLPPNLIRFRAFAGREPLPCASSL